MDAEPEADMTCPPLERLFDLARAGEGSPAADAVAHHARSCTACASALRWLERVLETTRGGPLPEAPPDVLERAIAIAARGRAATGGERRGWGLARLVRDSLSQPLPAGVRGAPGGERRLLYQAQEADLDLEISEAPEGGARLRLTGQLLVRGIPPQAGTLATLRTAAGAAVAEAAADPVGTFVFPAVSPGSYALDVWSPAEGCGVRVEALQLSTPGT